MKKRRITAIKMEVDSEVILRKVEEMALHLGYRMRPSTGSVMKKYVNKAAQKGLLDDKDDGFTLASALVATAMRQADKKDSKMLKVEDVDRGWNEELSLGPGNCPPYFCARRSIIERKEILKSSIPEFNALVTLINKKK